MDSSLKEVRLEVEVKYAWTSSMEMPIMGPFYAIPSYPIATEIREEKRMCPLTVYLQGDLENVCPLGELKHELVILTVHDVGTTPTDSFIKFANSPGMKEIRQKALFLHVCVPGQEPGAKDFVGGYPSTQNLAAILPQVLDHFGLSRCIAMGEGAGADIVFRFATDYPDMLNGVVLLHCTSTTHGFMENLKETFANLWIDEGKMSDSAWDYLIEHKFGKPENAEARKQQIQQIRALGLNEHNLSLYLHAFISRNDLGQLLEKHDSEVEAFLVTGGKSPHNKNVFHMFERMDKDKTSLIVAEHAVDVMEEAPEYLVETLNVLRQRHVCQRHAACGVQTARKTHHKTHHHADTAAKFEVGEMAKEENGSVEEKNKMEVDRTDEGRGGADGLPKPHTHADKAPILATTNIPRHQHSAPQEMNKPLIQVAAQEKTAMSSPTTAAIPQDPQEVLVGRDGSNANGLMAQNPMELLPGAQLSVEQPMSKCASSVSQMSQIQCAFCGKECCWCQEMPPGTPLE